MGPVWGLLVSLLTHARTTNVHRSGRPRRPGRGSIGDNPRRGNTSRIGNALLERGKARTQGAERGRVGELRSPTATSRPMDVVPSVIRGVRAIHLSRLVHLRCGGSVTPRPSGARAVQAGRVTPVAGRRRRDLLRRGVRDDLPVAHGSWPTANCSTRRNTRPRLRERRRLNRKQNSSR